MFGQETQLLFSPGAHSRAFMRLYAANFFPLSRRKPLK
jgi:hypothetical protein